MFGALARRMGASNRSIGRFLVVTLALGFASVLAAVVAAVLVTAANQRHTGWVNHTYEVRDAIAAAQLAVEQGETTRRGYLLTAMPVYRDAYRTNAAQVAPAIARLAALTRDNPRQEANVARYRRLVAAIVFQRERTVALVAAGRQARATALFAVETGARRMRAVRDQAKVMAAEEQRLLIIRDAEQHRSVRTFYAVVALAGLLLLLLGIVTIGVVWRYTRDLNTSRDALGRLNDTLEEQVAERTADLTRANDEIQRFAYIVSHDLRSPLVNVMGFTAELATATTPLDELIDRAEQDAPQILTEEARVAVREDLPEAIGFIRTSTQKMDRLINAILKLSREGRRTIAAEPIDLDALVEGVVASMQHVIVDRGATVAVAHPLPPVTSDRLAVEQILSNLVENATKYLQPGRAGRITVSGAREASRVTVSVADNGRGIATADHARVFDLFRRSGNQDQPGEGIGLAHVRALAYRLGGTIELRSELGVGSTFRLVLPATFAFQGARP